MQINHLRYRKFARLRHSTKFLRWLTVQAARLNSTPESLFNLMKAGATSAQIEAQPTPAP